MGQAEVEAFLTDLTVRGGFPEPALVNDLTRRQRLLREDIVDKVLKRDMTALYGVRRVLEVDGINRQSVNNFPDLFEVAHLIYRLRPFGYGREVLQGALQGFSGRRGTAMIGSSSGPTWKAPFSSIFSPGGMDISQLFPIGRTKRTAIWRWI